jgi:hypothetical protein
MKKIQIVMGLMVLTGVILSGCVSSKTTYYYEKDKNVTLTLYPDGRFVNIDPTSKMKGASGTYKFENNNNDLILIVAPFNTPLKFENNGSYLIDNEGTKWIKS